MKTWAFRWLIMILCIMSLLSATAEGLLPELTSVYRVAMPSLCDMLEHYPDTIAELEDGRLEETFNNVSEEEYSAFGNALGNDGCEMTDYTVNENIFSARVEKQGASFDFSYDAVEQVVVITYSGGAYDPVVKEAEKQYQEADSLLSAAQFEEAYDLFSEIIDYKDSRYLLDYDEGLAQVGLERRWPIGEILTFGNYEGEGLEWKIINLDGKRAEITTRNSIGKMRYNKNDEAATNWSSCSLRKWLNGTFYNEAFNSDEKKLIYETKLENPGSDAVSGGPDTKDRVYISSESISGQDGWAWIRKPGKRKNLTSTNNGHGGNAANENPVYPVVWINLAEYDSWSYTKVDPSLYTEADGQSSEQNESNMKVGSKGDDVKQLQESLIEKGYLSGSADGQFGKMTEAAVKAAQEHFGLEPTGIADKVLLEKLRE